MRPVLVFGALVLVGCPSTARAPAPIHASKSLVLAGRDDVDMLFHIADLQPGPPDGH